MALKEITLNSLPAAESFVNRTRSARWEGWDIVTFIPSHRAFAHPRGVFNRKTARWGFEYRYPVSTAGLWKPKVFAHGSR